MERKLKKDDISWFECMNPEGDFGGVPIPCRLLATGAEILVTGAVDPLLLSSL
jgi:hypothetical protein